jgi:hypothetical protein
MFLPGGSLHFAIAAEHLLVTLPDMLEPTIRMPASMIRPINGLGLLHCKVPQ